MSGCVYEGVSKDIGVSSIIDLANNCELTASETITIAVQNFGTESAADFELAFSIDGGTPIVEAFPTLLHIDETLPYTFSATADLSAVKELLPESENSIEIGVGSGRFAAPRWLRESPNLTTNSL